MKDIKNIIESLLFVADTPLSMDHLKNAIPEAETDQIQQTILALKKEYELKNGGFLIHEVAGGYQFRTRPEYKEWIRRLLQPKPPKLSKPAMETLAIIAYRQPMLRSEMEHIRGVNSGNAIRILLERKLIRVLGRREVPGRPLVYATTQKFLETFDLKNLKDLPSLKEIDEFETRSGNPRQQEIIFKDASDTASKNAIENNADNKNSKELISDLKIDDQNMDNNA
ncbi:MAG: SMC-Scp complex subunit ScpB [Desulfobacteraceae bacterium]|nr:SMC-Scp complex subunit ScpB [Desulfobacteraceae bacterium]